ncbi:SDR family NAD(P)-dependent oxidoreductase, partial [Providencia rettgeri]|nr:SDR family NAD(P)-dependent oxidoreductase [Providencia rettgeri]
MQELDLSGKTALVTGASRGIGQAIAKELMARGAKVIGTATSESGAQAISAVLDQNGSYGHVLNVDDPAACEALISALSKEDGGPHILVNNAGIQHTAPIEEFPVDKWNAIIALNLSAVFHGTAAALPIMQKQGWGRIINIAAAHGLVASVNKSAYVAAKHGVVGLTKVTALENAGKGITCNAICPGWVRTPLVEKQIEAISQQKGIDIEAAARELLAEKQPSLQFVTPEQLGGAAVFLS